ncbi:MAG: hypothetical protein QM725_14035 [Lacibacter sp.]
MKKYICLIFSVVSVLFFSCRHTKSITWSDEKELDALVKQLNKSGGNEKLIADLQRVYNDAFQKSSARLYNFYFEPVPGKWDKVVPEMEGIQRMYDIISQNAYAMRIVKPENFYQQLLLTKDSAASWYYDYGTERMKQPGRESQREAHDAFQKGLRFVSNYKDAGKLSQDAYNRSIVNVLVNQIQYDDYSMSSWGYSRFGNQDRMTHDRLIRDLGAQTASQVPARFFNEYDLRRSNLGPDFVIDLVWKNIRFDYPHDRTTTYNRSKRIETGKDTANKPVYQTVTATLYVTRRELNANADMNIIVSDANTRSQVNWEMLPGEFRYYYEFAEYRGDKRALDNKDLRLLNNNRSQQVPSKEEAMNEMMQKIYHSLVSRIKQTVNW